jgi:hypothetical protein
MIRNFDRGTEILIDAGNLPVKLGLELYGFGEYKMEKIKGRS